MPTYIQGTFMPEISMSITFSIEFATTGNLKITENSHVRNNLRIESQNIERKM